MAARKTDVLPALKAYFEPLKEELSGKKVAVCLSGGADSVALLRGMLSIKDGCGFDVCACHFNHMIRGAESDRDESFCKDLCSALGVELYRGRDDVPAYAAYYKISVEEAARECRYAYFQRMIDDKRFDYYATAHNMNDDAETLLLNLIRGSGSYGASSLASKNGRLLRPLLKVKRTGIENYLASIDQTFIHDSTNDNTDYTRNYIRKVVVPAIENVNPRAVEALAGFADSSRDDRAYFESETVKLIGSDLRNLPDALLDRVIIRLYSGRSGGSLNKEQINELNRAVRSGKRTVSRLNDNTEAVVFEGKINFLDPRKEVPVYPEQLLNDGKNSVFGGRVTVELSENPFVSKNFNILSINDTISFDNIKGGLKVRQRITGDKIRIFGMNKSVKKLFIEKKIPAEYRDIIPVVYDDAGIVYIPFIGITDRAFPRKDSQKTLNILSVFNTIESERWGTTHEE